MEHRVDITSIYTLKGWELVTKRRVVAGIFSHRIWLSTLERSQD